MVAWQRNAVGCLGAIACTASRRASDAIRAAETWGGQADGSHLLVPVVSAPCSASVSKTYFVTILCGKGKWPRGEESWGGSVGAQLQRQTILQEIYPWPPRKTLPGCTYFTLLG